MSSRSYASKAIRPEMTVRQVAADFPAAEEVFRRHGEVDSPPARFGHLEPLTHFARRQGVPLDKLLAELAAAAQAPLELYGRYAQAAHHVFLLTALAMTLTLGAGWGAWLLWQIGVRGQFSGAAAAHVIAHGEAQLWGFIVLFVMGVSLRTALEGAVRGRWGRWICRGLVLLAVAGVLGSVLWSVAPARLPWLGVASALSLCLMSLAFLGLVIAVMGAKLRFTWGRAVLSAAGWLTVWAAVTLVLRFRAGSAGPGAYNDDQRLLLIELAVFGFAMNAIYGFGQMLLPGFLRIGKVRGGAVELAHWLHNAGAILVCLATVFGGWSLGAVVGSELLIGGAAMFAIGHRGFIGRRRTSTRDEQGHWALDFYPPLAFFWLLASLALMSGGVLYEALAAAPLHHAYMGAVRHALTVGFMTTLILGVGQRLVPVLDRTVLALPGLVVLILALIGVGNLWRVSAELATLTTPAAYRVMPYSALLEWSALLLFTASLVRTMFRGDAALRAGEVTRRSSLAALLAAHPWIELRLGSGGAGYLERTRSVPSELTIGSFAESEGHDAAEMVSRINTWLAESEVPARM